MADYRKQIYAVDCDEVLMDIVPVWYKKLLNDKVVQEFFADHRFKFEDIPAAIQDRFSLRPNYYIEDYLQIDRGSEIYKHIYDLYFADPTFYDDIPFRRFAHSIETLARENVLDEVHVVTSCRFNGTINHAANESKRRRLQGWLDSLTSTRLMVKEIHMLDETTKSECLNYNNIDFTVFADDKIDNIVDVAQNCKYSPGKLLLIPMYGFNSPEGFANGGHPGVRELEEARNLAIRYFPNYYD